MHEVRRVCNIDISPDGAGSLRVVVGGNLVSWSMRLVQTAPTRALNALASALPDAAWASDSLLTLLGRLAGPALRTGRLNLSGRSPNGQAFRVRPRHVCMTVDVRATIDGADLGVAGPIADPVRLGDFRIPQRGMFVVGDARFAHAGSHGNSPP